MNLLTQFLDFGWVMLMRASIYAAIVFPLAYLACRPLFKMPRRIHCWIWRIAYFKVIVATIWITPVVLPILPIVDSEPQASIAVQESESQTPLSRPLFFDPINAQRTVRNEAPNVNIDWSRCLVVAWLFGFIFALKHSVQECRRVRIIRRTSKQCESGPLHLLCQKAALAMNSSTTPILLQSNQFEIPALVGFLRPAIVVPENLDQLMKPPELELILRHEIGHLKRMDLLWNWLPRITQLTLFFHPMVWLASRRWRVAQEIACDELVLDSAKPDTKTYGSALLRVVEMVQQNRNTSFSTMNAVGTYGALHERFVAMKHWNVWSRSQYFSALCFAVCLSLPGVVPFELGSRHAPRSFVNGGFETGDLSGWTVTAGQNATYAFDGVITYDIDSSGIGQASQVYSCSVGQVSNEPDVYRHVDITQEIYLQTGRRYEIGFDWSVENYFSIDNFDGGQFQLIIDGQALSSFDTQNVYTESVESGRLVASFTPDKSGLHAVGARICRRFPITFPNRQNPSLLQCVDNFSVRWGNRALVRSSGRLSDGVISDTGNERVNALFKQMRNGTFKGWSFPDLSDTDIPALLKLAEEERLLKSFPRNPISSQYESECPEGIVAVWLIEGIRVGSKFPSLNALCLTKELTTSDWTTASQESHESLVDAYRTWWKTAQHLSKDQIKEIDPLLNADFSWH